MESVESGYSGAKVVEMDTSCHKSRRHHMGVTSTHVHVYHNHSPYDFSNFIISENFKSGILKECINIRAATEDAGRKGDRLVLDQDFHFFYTRSHLSALQNCALIFSTNFQFNFTFKKRKTQFRHGIV